jgi:acetyl-CoA C-acetyltransferase
VSGPLLAQACATSVACIAAAAAAIEADTEALPLVVATDRTSNGPLLVYPRSQGMGGSPATEHWVLDSFAADPNTGQPMVATAENVARDGAMSRAALDELTLLRWQQYRAALADDRRFQRRYLQPVRLQRGKGKPLGVDADEGVHPYTAEALAALRPVQEGGVVTFGGQTHPADGCAGAVFAGAERARTLAAGDGVVRLLAAAFSRVDKAEMPKAATVAALAALREAEVRLEDVRFVVSHNPFAVNDLWFAQQTRFPLERMNPYGSSLIYGHPQGPTGLRGIVELAHALREAGGGIGVFTGCAAGDTGAALVLRLD